MVEEVLDASGVEVSFKSRLFRWLDRSWFAAATGIIGMLSGFALNILASILVSMKDNNQYAAAAILVVGIILLAAVAILLVAVAGKIDKIRNDLADAVAKVEKITEKVPLHVEYLDVQRDGAEKIYEEVGKVVCKAQHSVRALTSYLVDTKPDDNKYHAAKRRYFEKILDHIVKSDRKVKYNRIVQYPAGKGVSLFAGDGPYRDHILAMHDAEEKSHRVFVKKTQHTRPTTFVIIDHEYLVWQINAVGEGGQMEMQGMFIIHDPAGELIEHHWFAFERVLNNGTPLSSDEIRELRDV